MYKPHITISPMQRKEAIFMVFVMSSSPVGGPSSARVPERTVPIEIFSWWNGGMVASEHPQRGEQSISIT